MSISSDVWKAVSVRFYANPELQDGNVLESPEMCQKTIERLKWLKRNPPRLVLMPDKQNKDPHCVMVRALGKRIANLSKEDALEARAMMMAMNTEMLRCDVGKIVASKHGYFWIQKPICMEPVERVELGIDWNKWACEEMLMLPDEDFVKERELYEVIRGDLLPDVVKGADVYELEDYTTLWLESVQFNQCLEVQQAMDEMVRLLSADERVWVRQLAVEIDHQRTKRGTPEVVREMAEEWWPRLIQSSTTQHSFALLRRHWMGNRNQMMELLNRVEELMRPMPGGLYNDVGNVQAFFSHLNYLAPPRKALQGILSLLAIRTLLCTEMGLDMEPCFVSRIDEIKDIKDIRQLPTTIGRVMAFSETQCRKDYQIETMQLLVNWLERDCRGTRVKEIEEMIDCHKPAPNIHINTLVGSATGDVKQEIKEEPKLLT